MNITVRDLIQYLLLHTDLDDKIESCGILIPIKENSKKLNFFDEDDIEKWKEIKESEEE